MQCFGQCILGVVNGTAWSVAVSNVGGVAVMAVERQSSGSKAAQRHVHSSSKGVWT